MSVEDMIPVPAAAFEPPVVPQIEPVTSDPKAADALRWVDVTPAERARLNAVDSFRRGTSVGAATVPSEQRALTSEQEREMLLRGASRRTVQSQQERLAGMGRRREEINLDLARWELMSNAADLPNVAAAVGGAVAGAVFAPENLVALPGRAGLALTQFIERMGGGIVAQRAATGAAGAAATNLVTDPAVQGMNIQQGLQPEGFSPARTAIGTAAGGVIGGGVGALSGALARRGPQAAVETELRNLTAEVPPERPASPEPRQEAARVMPEAAVPALRWGSPEFEARELTLTDELDALRLEGSTGTGEANGDISRALERATTPFQATRANDAEPFQWAMDNGRRDIAEAIAVKARHSANVMADARPGVAPDSPKYERIVANLEAQAREADAFAAELESRLGWVARAVPEVAAPVEPPRLIGIEAPMPQHRVATASGESVEVRPVIVEARDLVTSADDAFDQRFQPRDRTRAASQVQIQEIVSRLDPQRLGMSAEADRGAPIVGPDSLVESGNGRVLAIRRAYEQGGESAARYREWLASQGVDVTGFEQPVLVRQRVTPMDDAQRANFTRAANQEATLQMSATERSASDAASIDADMLAMIRNTNDLASPQNRDFTRAFIARLPQSQQGALIQADGSLSAEGLTRARNAILSAAYGDTPIIARIVEATTDEAKSLTGALIDAAPLFAKLSAEIRAGLVSPDMDLAPALTEAVRRVIDLRAKGVKLRDFFDQVDAFDVVSANVDGFMRLMYRPDMARAAGRETIAERLRLVATEAAKVTNEASLDLGLAPVTARDILSAAERRGTADAADQGDIFSANAPTRAGQGVGDRTGPAIEVPQAAQAEAGREAAPAPRLAEKQGRTFLDTRGEGGFYHGTSNPSLKPRDEHYSTLNYYGNGFYTTEAVDVAWGYSKKGADRTGERVLFQVNERQPVKWLDAEAPFDGDARAILDELKARYEDSSDLVAMALDENPKNLRELYDAMRDISAGENISADTVQELFDDFRWVFQQLGYGGIEHQGGLRTKTAPHKVRIYWEPETQLEISRVPFERYDPPRDLLAARAGDGPRAEAGGVAGQGRGADGSGDGARAAGAGGDQRAAGDRAALGATRRSRLEDRLNRIAGGDVAPARIGSGRDLTAVDQRGPIAATADAAPVKSPQQIGADLSRALAIPLREGRLTLKGALGEFDYRDSVARVRQPADLQVTAHEIGHAVDQMFGKDAAAKFVGKHEAALQVLDIWRDPAGPPSEREVFAEFIRLWVTNRAYLDREFPAAVGEFADMIAAKAPQIAKAMDEAADAYRAFLSAPSDVALRSLVKVEEPPSLAADIKREGWMNTVSAVLATGRRWLFDDKDALKQLTREMLRVKAKRDGKPVEIETADDPYRRARLAENSANGAIIDLDRGVIPYGGYKPEGPSLKDAIATAMDGTGRWDEARMADFDAYLVARRGIQEWERFERGEIPKRPMAMSKEDLIQAKADLEARYGDAFGNAAAMVYDFNRRMLQKSLDAGLITRETFDVSTKVRDYVPFYRDMGEKAEGGAAKGQDPGDVEIVKGFKGSERDILSPMQSIIKQAYRTNAAVARNDSVAALARLADRVGPGSGAFVERIPASEMRALQVDAEEALISAARKAGMDLDEARQLAATATEAIDGDAIGTIFRAKQTGKRGEPIVFFREAGELKAIRLPDGDTGMLVYEALVPAPKVLRDVIVEWMGAVSTVVRTTATKNPAFIIANYLRDQIAAGILQPGFVPFYSGARGLSIIARGGDEATAYSAGGGIFGGEAVAMLDKVVNKGDVSKLTGDFSPGGLLHKLARFTEITEAGTRIGIYEIAYKRAIKRGLSPTEAHLDATWQATDYINFGQFGERTRVFNLLIPFFNAAMQGLYKSYRTGVEPLTRMLRGDVVTTLDQEAVRNAYRMWAALGMLGVAGFASRMFTLDDDRVNDASPEVRAKNWVIPIGDKMFYFPKPFELAFTFSAGERAAEAIMGDPRAAKGFAKDIYETFIPPTPWDNPVTKLAGDLKTGVSQFTGQPIVPDRLQRLTPEQQFTERTSFLARKIGEATGASPMYLDHIWGSLTAGLGRDVTALINAAGPDQPAQGWDDTIITRRFIKEGWRGTQNSREFWERMSPTTGKFLQAANTYDNFLKQGKDTEASQFLARLKPEERAFVIMNKSEFKVEDKRLHPLRRAGDAITAINGLLRENAANTIMSVDGREPVAATPEQRRIIRDTLTKMREIEARNALVIMGVEGWRGRELFDVSDDMKLLQAAAPRVGEELARRYAAARVYDGREVARLWPKVQQEVLRSGSEAQLAELRADVASAGFQFGSIIDNANVRRARLRRPQVAGSGAFIPQ